MKIRVTNVRLQTTIHIPGIGEIGGVLPPLSKTIPELSMYLGEGGHLFCTWARGNFFVGAANLVAGPIVFEYDPSPDVPTLNVVPKPAKEPQAS